MPNISNDVKLDKNEDFNKRLKCFTDYFNGRIDRLIWLCVGKGISKSDIARSLDVTRQAVDQRMKRILVHVDGLNEAIPYWALGDVGENREEIL